MSVIVGRGSLANSCGFAQASLSLWMYLCQYADEFSDFELDVYSNGERNNLHLRTADTHIVWQPYRASFVALAQ